ncbi:MAG: DUF924 family protein [Halieaceae bacterium]|jgi:uncharacterized protein (DUF924 family)|nr:DUF924 family protein [Halieaceae bacterium]
MTGQGDSQQAIAAIHQFWFGPLDDAGFAAPEKHRLWFSADPQADTAIAARFGHLVNRGLAGELERWAGSDAGLIALVLLLDQFPRNIYRGTARAFAGDSRALALARAALADGRHHSLPAIHRVFLYLPLEHCEELATQEECVALFTALAADTGAAAVDDFARYAVAHRDVIARFGRFPHRNAILGRGSTPEESAYLERHGGF